MPGHVVNRHRVPRPVRNYSATTLRSVARLGARTGRMMRAAYKQYKARTKSSSKPKYARKTVNHEQVSHSALESSTIRIKAKGKAKLLKGQKRMGTWRYQQTVSQRIKSVEGSQGAVEILFANTIQQLTVSSGVGYSLIQNAVALNQLNPYLTNTGSALLSSTVTPKEDRYVLKSVVLDLEFTNFEPVGCFMDLYIIKCKKYTNVSPLSGMNAGFQNEAFGLPPGLPAGTGAATIGYGSMLSPGYKPQFSPVFREFYSVVSVKSLELTAGATERVHVDIEVEKVIKTDELSLALASGNNYGNFSYSVIAITRGALVVDTTTTGVSFGPTSVGFAGVTRYACCAVAGGNDNRLNSNVVYNGLLATSIPANTVVLNEVDQQSNAMIIG